MKVDQSKLRVAGMVAAVVAVVGVTIIIGNSRISGGLTRGVSADVRDLAAGNVTIMASETYDEIVAKLNEYFTLSRNRAAQDNIVSEVVKTLEEVQR